VGAYQHYALEMSLYSGKTRAYLRYKGIPFVERPVRAWTGLRLQRIVGALVIPVLRTPQGEWLQDTAHIIDTLESRHPETSVIPSTPRQRLAAYLLELWGDEFWLPPAMHYRWNFQENLDALLMPEAGRNLLPGAPRLLQRWMARKVGALPQRFLAPLGVKLDQIELIERWAESMCDALDQHFAEYPYLLGTRPSLGDFGLIGPLYAHLGRDPYPARELIAPRRHLAAWVQRMQRPQTVGGGDFLAGDEIPESLAPLLASVFHECGPFLALTQNALLERLAGHPPGQPLPRTLAPVEIPYAGGRYRLRARSFLMWKLQRVLDDLARQPPPARAQAEAWAAGHGGPARLSLPLPRLRRVALALVAET
jgi:glutathione S-transferase